MSKVRRNRPWNRQLSLCRRATERSGCGAGCKVRSAAPNTSLTNRWLEGTSAPDQHDVFMITARIMDKPSEICVYDYACS